MSIVLENPAHMIRNGAPRIIHDDTELATYTAELLRLTCLESPSMDEWEAIDLLTLLIETYEARFLALKPSNPVEILRFLMEHNGLKQKDLVEQLGSDSVVSEVLNGRRSLTVGHIQKLCARFHVSADLFL